MYSFNFVAFSNGGPDAIRGAVSPLFAADVFAVTFSSFPTGSPLDRRKALSGEGSSLAPDKRHDVISSIHHVRN